MLSTLLESNAPRQRRRASAAASVAVHTVIIGGAIAATASARSTIPPTTGHVVDQRTIFTRPIPPRPSAPSRPTRPPVTEGWVDEVRSPVARFPDSAWPLRVGTPAEIDPSRLLAADTLLPSNNRTHLGGGRGAGPTGLAADEPATLATVERPAALVTPPRPKYPDPLRAAGITGRVVVRLVVDTTGRVEPASVAVRESSHHLFTQAVSGVLPALRFRPAEVGSRKVRMLVDLPFEFRLTD